MTKPVLAICIGLLGCDTQRIGDCTDATFAYGCGHPGAGLPHGGQMFLELIHTPSGDTGQLNAWAREFEVAPDPSETPIPKIPSNTCTDISTPVFPRPPLAGSAFRDLGAELSVVSEDGVTHTAPRKAAPSGMPYAFTDNLQYGIPLGYQLQPFDAAQIQHGKTYKVQLDGIDAPIHPNEFVMSPRFEIHSPPVGKAALTLTRGQALDFSWQPINQDVEGHRPDRTFSFVILLGTPNTPTPGQTKWFCPLNDGDIHSAFSIPPEVIDTLPNQGLIVMGQQTHVIAELDGRRFDLITIECNRSPFTFAP